ncbi:MAG: PIG-L deacetylase family protein [Thermoanaerobaculia bacterium]
MTAFDNVLVVAAHPDDEVLGCGATISRLARTGKVSILILGEGFTSRAEQRQSGAPELNVLRNNAEAAARVMNASAVEFGGLPDNRFDELALLDVVKLVERAVERIAPTAIFTHHGGDLNVDHQVTFRSVLTATRPMKGHSVRELYSFEVASSTEWAFGRFESAFRPNFFVDVESSIEQKLRAMNQYPDEMRPFPHPRSEDALRAIARRWGSVVGCEYAEAFELIRGIQ